MLFRQWVKMSAYYVSDGNTIASYLALCFLRYEQLAVSNSGLNIVPNVILGLRIKHFSIKVIIRITVFSPKLTQIAHVHFHQHGLFISFEPFTGHVPCDFRRCFIKLKITVIACVDPEKNIASHRSVVYLLLFFILNKRIKFSCTLVSISKSQIRSCIISNKHHVSILDIAKLYWRCITNTCILCRNNRNNAVINSCILIVNSPLDSPVRSCHVYNLT